MLFARLLSKIFNKKNGIVLIDSQGQKYICGKPNLNNPLTLKLLKKDLNWKDLKYGIISEINDYYSKGNKVVVSKDLRLEKILSKSASDPKSVQSNEIIDKINEVLDSKIRPAVARDGGDITFKSFTDGVVTVELKGSCSGCPSSIMTLKQGVQNLLCHYIPEVKSVEAI